MADIATADTLREAIRNVRMLGEQHRDGTNPPETRRFGEQLLLVAEAASAPTASQPSASSVETAERIVREWSDVCASADDIGADAKEELAERIAAALTAERRARETLEDAVLAWHVGRTRAEHFALQDRAGEIMRIRAARAGDGEGSG